MKHEAWAADLESLDLALDDRQLASLAAYLELLDRIAVPRGMIAPSDAGRLWERHVADGLRGVAELPPAIRVADIGSGAGIPGVPLAIAAPTSRFVLIEPRRARAAFLEAVVDELRLVNVEVMPGRVEDAAGPFGACVARAFSSARATWEAARRLLGEAGVLLYWAGESFEPAAVEDLGVAVRLSTHFDLARTGPLVIMGPQ